MITKLTYSMYHEISKITEFLKISNEWTHVDARNPKKTDNKTEWVDAEGKPLGNRPVYLKGHKL